MPSEEGPAQRETDGVTGEKECDYEFFLKGERGNRWESHSHL